MWVCSRQRRRPRRYRCEFHHPGGQRRGLAPPRRDRPLHRGSGYAEYRGHRHSAPARCCRRKPPAARPRKQISLFWKGFSKDAAISLPPHEIAHVFANGGIGVAGTISEEHTSELQSLISISYAVFCLKKKIQQRNK